MIFAFLDRVSQKVKLLLWPSSLYLICRPGKARSQEKFNFLGNSIHKCQYLPEVKSTNVNICLQPMLPAMGCVFWPKSPTVLCGKSTPGFPQGAPCNFMAEKPLTLLSLPLLASPLPESSLSFLPLLFLNHSFLLILIRWHTD